MSFVKDFIAANPLPTDYRERSIAAIDTIQQNIKDFDIEEAQEKNKHHYDTLLKIHARTLGILLYRYRNRSWFEEGEVFSLFFDATKTASHNFDTTRTDWKYPTFVLNAMNWHVKTYEKTKIALIRIPDKKLKDFTYFYDSIDNPDYAELPDLSEVDEEFLYSADIETIFEECKLPDDLLIKTIIEEHFLNNLPAQTIAQKYNVTRQFVSKHLASGEADIISQYV